MGGQESCLQRKLMIIARPPHGQTTWQAESNLPPWGGLGGERPTDKSAIDSGNLPLPNPPLGTLLNEHFKPIAQGRAGKKSVFLLFPIMSSVTGKGRENPSSVKNCYCLGASIRKRSAIVFCGCVSISLAIPLNISISFCGSSEGCVPMTTFMLGKFSSMRLLYLFL